MKLPAILLTGIALSYGITQASAVDAVLILNLTNKTVEVEQTIAIRENVYTEIRGIGDSASTNLTLRISLGTTTYASASSFTNYGTNATSAIGYVDLNTSEFTNFFAGAQPELKRSFSIAVWDTVLAKLLLNDMVEIQNNPYLEGMPDPSPVGVTYMQQSVTGANWQVSGGNLQLWDTVDEMFRDVYFRQGSIVAGYTNDAIIGGGPTNFIAPELMGIMLSYAIPNPSYGHLAYYDTDGKWNTASPNDLFSIGSITGAVDSVFGRAGDVVAVATDYDDYYAGTAQVAAVEAEVDILNTNTVDRTGARGMQAPFNAGGFGITNISTNSLKFSDGVSITSTKIQLYDTLNTAKVAVADYLTYTNAQHGVNTGFDGRLDLVEPYTSRVVVVEGYTNRVVLVEGKATTNAAGIVTLQGRAGTNEADILLVEDYTNRAAAALASSVWASADSTTNYALRTLWTLTNTAFGGRLATLETYTNRVVLAEGLAETNQTGIATLTGDVGVIHGSTGSWTQTATDFPAVSNAAITGSNLASQANAYAVAASNLALIASNTAAAALASNTWAAADSTTNYALRTLWTETNSGFGARITAVEGYTGTTASAIQSGDNVSELVNDAGYLTTTQGIYGTLYVANRSQLDTNICGLTQGVYTGSVTSVAYTGSAPIVVGRMYDWGFYKQNAFGTSILAIAGETLTVTAAGTASNYFVCKTSGSELILTLIGNGSSKSDVTNVYLRQITNGFLAIADDLYVGDDLYLGNTNSIIFPDTVTVTSAKIQSYDRTASNFPAISNAAITGSNLAYQANGYAVAGSNLALLASNQAALAQGWAQAGSNLAYSISLSTSSYSQVVADFPAVSNAAITGSNLAALVQGLAGSNAADIVLVEGLAGTNQSRIGLVEGLAGTNAVDIVLVEGLAGTNAADIVLVEGLAATNQTRIGLVEGLAETNAANVAIVLTGKYDRAEAMTTNAAIYTAIAAGSPEGWSAYPATQLVQYAADDPVATVATNLFMGASDGGEAAPWTAPTNSLLDDGQYAAVDLGIEDWSGWLSLTNINISLDNSRPIKGIEIIVKSLSAATNTFRGYLIHPILGNSSTDSFANSSFNIETNSLGGPTDLWGLSWSMDNVSNNSFGCALRCDSLSTTSGMANIDVAKVKIYYTPSLTNWTAGADTNDDYVFQYDGVSKFAITDTGATGLLEGISLGQLRADFGPVSNAAITGSNLAYQANSYAVAGSNLALQASNLAAQAATDASSWTNNKLYLNDGSDLTGLTASAVSWSQYPATQNVNMAGFPLTNAGPIVCSNRLEIWDVTGLNHAELYNSIGIGKNIATRINPSYNIDIDYPPHFTWIGQGTNSLGIGSPADFIGFSPVSRTNIWAENPISFSNSMILRCAPDAPGVFLGVGRYPGYALDVRGIIAGNGLFLEGNANLGGNDATNFNNLVGNTVTVTRVTSTDAAVTNLQIVGGSPTIGAGLTATNVSGQSAWIAGPAFLADLGGTAKTVSNAVWTLLPFTNEVYDIGGVFNPATSRFTPTILGRYLITLSVAFDAHVTLADIDGYATIYKNGVLYKANIQSVGGNTYPHPVVTFIENVTNTVDYYEPYAMWVSKTNTVLGAATYTFFSVGRMP